MHQTASLDSLAMRLLERLLERRVPVPRQPDPPDRVGQLELLNEQITARLTRQLEEISALDNKATTILAANGVVLGLVISSLDVFASTGCAARLALYAALVVLATGLVAGVWMLWPVNWKLVPKPRPLVDGYRSQTRAKTLGALIAFRVRAYETNQPLQHKKQFRLRAQMLLLVASGVTVVAAYLLNEFGR